MLNQEIYSNFDKNNFKYGEFTDKEEKLVYITSERVVLQKQKDFAKVDERRVYSVLTDSLDLC